MVETVDYIYVYVSNFFYIVVVTWSGRGGVSIARRVPRPSICFSGELIEGRWRANAPLRLAMETMALTGDDGSSAEASRRWDGDSPVGAVFLKMDWFIYILLIQHDWIEVHLFEETVGIAGWGWMGGEEKGEEEEEEE